MRYTLWCPSATRRNRKPALSTYLRHSKRTYGPIILQSPYLFVSKPFDSKKQATAFDDYISNVIGDLHFKITIKHRPKGHVLHLQGDEHVKEKLLNTKLAQHRFQRQGSNYHISPTELMQVALPYPYPEVELSDAMEDVLYAQRQIHDFLHELHIEHILPILEHGIDFHTATLWLRDKKGTKESLLKKILRSRELYRAVKNSKDILCLLGEYDMADKSPIVECIQDAPDSLFKKNFPRGRLEEMIDSAQQRLTLAIPEGSIKLRWDSLQAEIFIPYGEERGIKILTKQNEPVRQLVAFDLEVRNYRGEDADPQVYLGQLSLHGEKEGAWAYGEFDIGTTRIVSGYGIKAWYGEMPPIQVAAATSTKIRDLEPTIIVTQNGNYDARKLEGYGGASRISVDNQEPKPIRKETDPSKQFREQWFFPGTVHLDCYRIVRNYFRSFLASGSHNLEAQASFWNAFEEGFNFDFEKSLSYLEQDANVIQAQKGNKKAAYANAAYGQDDEWITAEIGILYLRTLEKIARIARIPLQDACSLSPYSVALRMGNREHFYRFSEIRDTRPYDMHSSEFDDKRNELFGIPKNKGRFKARVVYIPLLYHGARDIIRHKSAKLLETAAKESDHPLDKMMLMRVADGFGKEACIDAMFVAKDPRKMWAVTQKYGNRDIISEMRERTSMIRTNQIINVAKDLLFLHDVDDSLLRLPYVVDFGQADVISIAPGRVVFKMRGEIFSSGYQLPSRKRRIEADPHKGIMTNLELKTLRDYIEMMFESEQKALENVIDVLHQMERNKLPDEEYLSCFTVKDEPGHMTLRQQRDLRGRIIKQFRLRKGETCIWGMDTKPRRYRPGKGFEEEFRRDFKWYSKFFRKGSRLWTLLDALYIPEGSAKKQREDDLVQLLSGDRMQNLPERVKAFINTYYQTHLF